MRTINVKGHKIYDDAGGCCTYVTDKFVTEAELHGMLARAIPAFEELKATSDVAALPRLPRS